jgi:hypothetical protein
MGNLVQGLLKKNEKNLARSFNFMVRYIDDVLSLNNFRLGDFVDLIYPIEPPGPRHHFITSGCIGP